MKLLQFVETFGSLIAFGCVLLYLYQGGYLALGLLLPRNGKRAAAPVKLGRYAVLISARNEAGVIGELIASLKGQSYPAELLDIYVVADNCTDSTATAARAAGATVYRRYDRQNVGKGYALDFLLKRIWAEGKAGRYDGYFVFDADNIVDPNFVYEMNRTFQSGNWAALTGYRNSKNFGQNWITAGYSIWFLREARFLNGPRMALGTNCHVSGTGFLVSGRVLLEQGGWPYHLLTEDLEFSAQCTARGLRIGYCPGAVIYDEQPADFLQAWDQRLRWSKGFYQVDGKYAPTLLKGAFRGGRRGWGCYDLLMTITPGVLLSLVGGAFQLVVLLCCLLSDDFQAKAVLLAAGEFLWSAFASFYLGMLFYAAVVVLSEWANIRAAAWQKLIYLPLFPIFMLTYIPISVQALFQKVEWKPIRHSSLAQLDQAA